MSNGAVGGVGDLPLSESARAPVQSEGKEDSEVLEKDLSSKEVELETVKKDGGKGFFSGIKEAVAGLFSDGKENSEAGVKNQDAEKIEQEISKMKLEIQKAEDAKNKGAKCIGVRQEGELTVTTHDVSDIKNGVGGNSNKVSDPAMQNAIAAALKGGASLNGLEAVSLSDAAPDAAPKAGLEGVEELKQQQEGAAR